MISCGGTFTLILDNAGTLWGAGERSYSYGSLGNIQYQDDSNELNVLGKIATGLQNKIISLSAGLSHSLFLDEEGSVWGCGKDTVGELGTGSGETVYDLSKFSSMPLPVAAISAGINSSFFLDRYGKVWTCGKFTKTPGEILQIANVPSIKSIATAAEHALFLDVAGDVWMLTKADLVPEMLRSPVAITQIAAGGYHSFFIDEEGSAWSVGQNNQGQLGTGDKVSKLVPNKVQNSNKMVLVGCGWHHSILLDSDGAIWVCGSNEHGQIGMGTLHEVVELVQNEDLPLVQHFVTSYDHTFFVDIFSNTWVCGYNWHSQLGFEGESVKIPVQMALKICCSN